MIQTDPKQSSGNQSGPHSSHHRSAFTTRAQAKFRGGARRRMFGAFVLALAVLAAFVIFGPEEDAIKERFEYYGAPDEMRIMNEISIDDGRDLAEKVPRSLRVPPPPARLEIEEDKPSPDGSEVIPEEREADPNRIDVSTRNPVPEADVSEQYQVEMSLPMQTNRDFYLVHMVRPEYPLGASEHERRTPVIVIKVGLFVDPQGNVAESMILASNGSEMFERAALEAVRDWKFGWLVEPGAGRWLQFPFNFKSPYFTPGR